MESINFSIKDHEVKLGTERIKEIKGISENITRGATQSQRKTNETEYQGK